ncbi:hypothetical protein TNCT_489591 [Trichonephila clavata]|uniref:Uncharacterized protein n=1 Tax=Trichonephila clavata TaxID=2740835 RepID=A0A8X6F9Q0_TRICU|nr:hypothetical protein TNCT_489591 [Trichonephila clavata]
MPTHIIPILTAAAIMVVAAKECVTPNRFPCYFMSVSDSFYDLLRVYGNVRIIQVPVRIISDTVKRLGDSDDVNVKKFVEGWINITQMKG